MIIKQGKSSDILVQLYGDIKKYQTILEPYQNDLITGYPNANLEQLFSSINKKIIAVAPMAFCETLLLDLDKKVDNQDLAALGLHMLSISTHDDVVDEMPRDRIGLAALVYAGNIASNEGSKILLKRGKRVAADILLKTINENHYYQQHVIETLWQSKPESLKDYLDGVHHICVFVSIGLMYALALADRMDLKEQIKAYSNGYGIALQLVDDLRETEEDKKNGYWSFPLIEGKPYTESFNQIKLNIKQARAAIPEEWRRMRSLLDKLELYVSSLQS